MIAMSFALWEFNKYAVWLVVCGGLELIVGPLFLIAHEPRETGELHIRVSLCLPSTKPRNLFAVSLC